MVTLLYKLVNNQSVLPDAPLVPRVAPYPIHAVHSMSLFGRTCQYSNSFFSHTPRLWNNLLPDVLLSSNVCNVFTFFFLGTYSY